MSAFRDLTGQVFGRLTVLRRVRKSDKTVKWECRCSCGTICVVARVNLVKQTRSCGCLRVESIIARLQRHGSCYTVEYQAWASMKNRCLNPKGKNYQRYGGRGIQICDRWLNSFESFLEDMGKRPTNQHSLERIDNNGNYESQNCCWALRREQARNTCQNVLITYNGESLTQAEWAARMGVKYSTLTNRLRAGWPVHLALTMPIGKSRREVKEVLHSDS